MDEDVEESPQEEEKPAVASQVLAMLDLVFNLELLVELKDGPDVPLDGSAVEDKHVNSKPQSE